MPELSAIKTLHAACWRLERARLRPAAAGRNLARSSRQHAAWSVLIALTSGIAGLLSAYAWDTSAGAAIVLYAAAWYFLSLLLRTVLHR